VRTTNGVTYIERMIREDDRHERENIKILNDEANYSEL